MKKVLLMILDGWGIGKQDKTDAIFSTPTPNITGLLNKYPHSVLYTSGENVGLPDGQMGNSEVGHLNIGAGRVVYQDLVKINKAIESKEICKNEALNEAFAYAKKNNKQVHLIGLLGDGGVHALSSHMYALCDMATDMGLDKVFVHALTDGRDTDPRSGLTFLKEDVAYLKKTNAKIATLIGRYYGMDRDKNWNRVKLAYDLLTKGEGKHTQDVVKAMEESYQEGVTDEFIKPIVVVDGNDRPVSLIREDDVVICFNYRTDRLRQMTTVFTQQDFPEFEMKKIPLKWYTMTCYSAAFEGINVIFDKDNIQKTLGEVVAAKHLKQIRIAETEKYAHVTFFFNGGREDAFEGESRILVPSPKVATYDLQPEMSAPIVTEKIVEQINNKAADFICLNYANGDMVGHTGVYEAIQKAVTTVDECVGKTVAAARANGYDVLIIADHGNADNAVNEDGSPNTAHSLNPVPCIWITDDTSKTISSGVLADVAPTVLKIMGVEQPVEMTGKSLVK